MFIGPSLCIEQTHRNNAWQTMLLPPPHIAQNYGGFAQWRSNRISQFDTKCPSARLTTYYVDPAGSDSANGLSEATAFATIDKVSTVIAASNGNVRIRFKRDGVWIEVGKQIRTTKVNITVDDYGTGTNNPIHSQFSVPYTTGWTLSSGAYFRAELNDIAWVYDVNDKLGLTRGTHLIRLASAAAVQATPNSWWWDPTLKVLWVNLNGDDPNTKSLAGCISNTLIGISLIGDGSRVENIDTYGYGCHRTNTQTQAEGIKSEVSGNDALYVKGCKSYYGSSHAMAHYALSGTGGKVLFHNCVAGFTKYSAGSGETIFNAFAANGQHEVWFENCQVQFGTLKSSDWDYATLKKRGRGFYGHTSGGAAVALLINNNRPSITASHCPANAVGAFANVPDSGGVITAVRAFTTNSIKYSTGDSGRDEIDLFAHNINYAMFDYSKRINESPFAFSAGLSSLMRNCWYINFYIEADCSLMSGGIGIHNRDAPVDNRVEWWHGTFAFTNHDNLLTSAIDYKVKFNTNTVPDATAASLNSHMINCVIQYAQEGQWTVVGVYNHQDNLKNNGYYNCRQYANKSNGYDNDAGKIILTSPMVLGTPNAQLKMAGNTSLGLSHDINGNPRTVSPPDVGPEDWSSSPPPQWQTNPNIPSWPGEVAITPLQLVATAIYPLVYSVVSGAWPGGISMDSSGLVTGTPISGVSGSITVRARKSTDAANYTDRVFSWWVLPIEVP